jgi:hypothetical protein
MQCLSVMAITDSTNPAGGASISALNLLSSESMKSFQELADEAFRDLLHNINSRPI